MSGEKTGTFHQIYTAKDEREEERNIRLPKFRGSSVESDVRGQVP